MAKKNKNRPNAIDLLTEQNREVEELFSTIEESRDPDDKQALFDDLADKLAIHTRIEEQYFYPAVRERKTEDMVLEAFVEHTSIKRLLADLLATDCEDESWGAQMKVLEEQVEHHVEEEENELFPAARKLLSADELVSLAQEMTAVQEELEEQEPRNLIPEEIGVSQPTG